MAEPPSSPGAPVVLDRSEGWEKRDYLERISQLRLENERLQEQKRILMVLAQRSEDRLRKMHRRAQAMESLLVKAQRRVSYLESTILWMARARALGSCGERDKAVFSRQAWLLERNWWWHRRP